MSPLKAEIPHKTLATSKNCQNITRRKDGIYV
jgi:hypothetical protein